MAGSQDVGGFSHYSEEVCTNTASSIRRPGNRPKFSEEQQAASGEVLPIEDRSLSHWTIPKVDEE